MSYESFKQDLISAVSDNFSAETSICINSITKNNNVLLDGLIIKEPGIEISPTIYVNDFYYDFLNGKNISDIAHTISDIYFKSISKVKFNPAVLKSFSNVKDSIIYKLINYKANEDTLKDRPYFKFLDLAIVFDYSIKDFFGNLASIKVTNAMLKLWNIDKNTLYETAKVNTPKLMEYTIFNLMDYLLNTNFSKPSNECDDKINLNKLYDNEFPMKILTNQAKSYGAAVLLYDNLINEIADSLNSDLIIIPSSVHELIIVKGNLTNGDKFNDIVNEVNKNEVAPEDYLSNHVYFFSREKQCISY